MKLAFNFGRSVAVLPSSVLPKLDKASKKDIKVLFAIAAIGVGIIDIDNTVSELSEKLCMKTDEITNSLAFWRGAGVLEDISPTEETAKSSSTEKAATSAESTVIQRERKKLKSADELPEYSTRELSDLLEKREEYRFLVDECQQMFGKIFTTAEVNMVVALSDYLALDGDYILLLFSHCGKLDYKSVRAVEKLAHRFLDEGICDADTLAERLHALEAVHEVEGQIRKLFGITSRSLTKKEKALIEKWIGEYAYGMDIVEKAYEVTVDSTGKASIPYAGAVMDRWFGTGIKTVEDIEKDIAEHKKNKPDEGGSFDTDEFLEAALKRSFENKQ